MTSLLQDPNALWDLLRLVAVEDIRVWSPWIGNGMSRHRLAPNHTLPAQVWQEKGETDFRWAINLVAYRIQPARTDGRAPTLQAAMDAADTCARSVGVLLASQVTLSPGPYLQVPFDRGFRYNIIFVSEDGRIAGPADLSEEAAFHLNGRGVPFTDACGPPWEEPPRTAGPISLEDFPVHLSKRARRLAEGKPTSRD